MMKNTIYYKPKQGVNTRDTLREISAADNDYLVKVMDCYQKLAKADSRWQFEDWFNQPNKLLPRHGRQFGFKPNTPKSWCEGIAEKLKQRGRDLSPQQCSGIETLSTEIAKWFDPDLCPTIEFKDKADKASPYPQQFNNLFE